MNEIHSHHHDTDAESLGVGHMQHTESHDPHHGAADRHDTHRHHHANSSHDTTDQSSHHGGHGAHQGHDKHAGHSPEMFRRRFWGSLLLTLPILYFDAHIQAWLGYQAISFPGMEWISPVLSTVLFFYGGWVFVASARHELADRQPGMMTMIALAISVAYVYSLSVAFGFDGMPLYWELATLITIMLLGHWIEMASVQGAGKALEHLASLVPSTAIKLTGGRTEEVPVDTLATGDRILIRPGAQIPVDGLVLEGASSVNEAFLTGESRPVSKGGGDGVVAGAVNGEGALTVEVQRTGDATTLSQIKRLVEEAQVSRSRFQNLADRAAGWLTYIAIGAGTLTFAVWLTIGFDMEFAIVRTVTVLVMACPHALGLAIPLVIVNASAMSAKNGILVRNREAFERARNLKIVAFDKTGTLTEGHFGVRAIHTDELSEEDALRLAASIEDRSEHPLGKAIVEEALDRGVEIKDVTDFEVIAGQGVAATVEGERYRIGRPEWLSELGLSMPNEMEKGFSEAEERGESVIVLLDASRPLALFALADRVRQSAEEAVAQLKAIGVEPVMITGDADAVARTVADALGIERFYARVLPKDKARIVSELRSEGPTAFVGDGINDAPALLEADLGVAIGAGTNIAIESADLVLIENDPVDVVRALRLSKATYRKMIQNLFWATGYNAIALPLAAGVAIPLGLVLSPAVGAIFMSASTIIVAINAMMLRRVRLA